LVLVAVTMSFAALDYVELREQFEERRDTVNEQYLKQVQGLLEQSAQHLKRLGTAIASLPDVRNPLAVQSSRTEATRPHANELKANARVNFEHIVSTLELDLGIETAAIFSRTGERLVTRGVPTDDITGLQLGVVVRRAMDEETPLDFYHCADTCLLFAVAPVLGDEQSVGAILLGLPPADVVRDFKTVSGTDIGLIVSRTAQSAAVETHRMLPQWTAHIIALSNFNRNAGLLRNLAVERPVLEDLKAPQQFGQDGRQYEIRLVSLESFGPAAKAHMVFIADITEELRRIKAATGRSLALGIGGLILSEALLMATLWTPMSRLRRAADTLPKLAHRAYDEVRLRITKTRRSGGSRDEVDVLDDTAIALSYQLEALNSEVNKRTQDLSERMAELAQERDFITHILNPAQAIIVTQNSQNEILMLNRHGERLTGYTAGELHGRPFVSLLADETLGPGLMPRLADLGTGRRDHLEEEWDVRCKDGSTLNVVWLHSRLNGQFREAPTVLSIGMDITARKRAELRLAWLADHDPLTGLFNRRRFQEELKEAIAASKRYQHGGALLFFDLDQFKYVNDTSGHRVGDLLLERLGESLPRLLREVDIIGRLGGDEFAAVLPRATADEAVQVARKILAHIRECEFRARGRVHKASASIGIALFPQDGNNVRDLLAHADLAMYRVKETGRGGWHLFSSEDQSRQIIQDRVLWKERVEHALAQNRFLLYVQPIIDLRDNTTSHYEILLRMQAEDGSVIAPAQFIQVAERSGLIHAIDRLVLADALHYQARLQTRGRVVTFSINLSAHAFNDPELLPHLKRLLEETQVDPQRVILEMTETAAVGDLAAARRLIESIRALGCHFALDDFGTGFSSFFYMRELPMEFIKIDGSFIRGLAASPDDQALVRAMSQIAKDFGKKTVAEQVENEETMSLLRLYGIDYAQGYLTGRPAPVDEVFGP
jgi:diguanylate cyclase (GGDEF)-like protein/PAS domain S-box-containing protein